MKTKFLNEMTGMLEEVFEKYLTNSTFLVGFGCGLSVGFLYIMFDRHRNNTELNISAKQKQFEDDENSEFLADGDGEYKLVLVVRQDLKMGKGKVATQCSHAAVLAYQQAVKRDPKALKEWEYSGQAKISLKIDNEEEMLALQKKARAFGLITSIVRDAGRTQIAPGSKTVLAIGPGSVDVINKITGDLKLY